MKITLEEYSHTCADGCCDTWGYDVFVDGKNIGSIVDDDVNGLVDLLNEFLTSKKQ